MPFSWSTTKKPVFVLAPMYDVTDAAFRAIIAKYGKPDIMWTEFVSAEGLANEIGRKRLEHQLGYSEAERPILAQIFGSHPKAYAVTAPFIEHLGFDGIDINMGCPDKNIMKQGSCAALFRTPQLAQEIIRETKRNTSLPVSVKIRIGDTKIDWQDWIKYLLEAEPAAITVHLRTRKEMSKVPAHWELMPEIVEFIKSQTDPKHRPVIIGNGDINSLTEAEEKVKITGIDGVMIGRGIFGNPWLFDRNKTEITIEGRLSVLAEHARLYETLFQSIKPFQIMKRHFKAYVNDFEGSKELRMALMEARNAEEVETVCKSFLKKLAK